MMEYADNKLKKFNISLNIKIKRKSDNNEIEYRKMYDFSSDTEDEFIFVIKNIVDTYYDKFLNSLKEQEDNTYNTVVDFFNQ